MEGIHRGPVACLAAGPAMQTLHRDPSSILALLTERCWDFLKKNCPILQVYIYIYIHPEVDRVWDVLKDIPVFLFEISIFYLLLHYTHVYIYTQIIDIYIYI